MMASVQDDLPQRSRRCCPDEGCCANQNCCTKQKANRCCKRFLVFMVSHVGLTAFVIGYALLGGLIFMTLESPHELRQKAEVGEIRSVYVQRLWEVTERLNVMNQGVWMAAADDSLQGFQYEVYRAVKEEGWGGTETENEVQWSYAGALLYSVTTITTIGYGHIAPKTAWGRVATIIYASIGIPLTLLCLANIGEFLGVCVKFFYARILCGLCRRRRQRRQPSALAAGNQKARPQVDKPTGSCACCQRQEAIDGPSTEAELESPASGEPGEVSYPDDQSNKDTVRVPVLFTLGIMAAYIFGGAMLFTLWEDEWDYLVGAYFCFITLSTIGFGDYVPGTNIQSWASQEKQVLCSLYLLFGLALLAMAFNLMQEQVRYTCKRLGMCLGIIQKKA